MSRPAAEDSGSEAGLASGATGEGPEAYAN